MYIILEQGFGKFRYIAIDRLTGEIVGRSNDYISICKRFKEQRYTIIVNANGEK